MEAPDTPARAPDGDGGGGLIGLSIRRPVGVWVGVILVVLFGLLSVRGLPIQLTPDIEIPTLEVSTAWPGASPLEVEREILQEQEEVLKSVAGLERMVSQAQEGAGTVTLEFAVGTPLDEALVRTSNRLAQVPDYPTAAREPVLSTGNSAGPPLAVLMLQAQEGREVAPYRTWVEQEILPQLERIPGVAGVRMFGGRESMVEIAIDPAALASRGVPLRAAVTAIQGELRDVSGGTLDLGKQRYVVRTEVIPEEVEHLEALVLASAPDGRGVVRLGDVAEVRRGLRRYDRKVLANGRESLVLLFDREAGSNVLATTEEILVEVERLNAARLAPEGLTLSVVSDQTEYIYGALGLVRSNLFMGGALAVGVLLLFLRSIPASAVIAAAIPICVMGTILGMDLLGRSVNVVSLAGMAFAVGMVVDNAIVVLENIETWRARGASPAQAALRGTQEVWGAILASTLTTAAVFLPIISWRNEVGELLRDVAVAISLAVGLSLVVSVLVIPSFAAQILSSRPPTATTEAEGSWDHRIRETIVGGVGWLLSSGPRSLMAVVGSMAAAALLSVALLPPMEYLPTGNRNLLFGVLVPPPGYSVAEMAAIGQDIQDQIVPHLGVDDGTVPAIFRTFFIAMPGQGMMGVAAQDPQKIGEVATYVRGILRNIPGVTGIANQSSLFGRNLNGSRSVDIEITGADLEVLSALGGELMGAIRKAMPEAQVRPLPSLDAGGPALQVRPLREEAARLGLNPADIGLAVDTLIDGSIIGELGRPGEPQLDVVLRARQEARSPGDLMAAPVATPSGMVVPLGTIAEVRETLSPTSIRRIERRRSITLQLTPPEDIAIEAAMDILEGPVLAGRTLPEGVQIDLSGAADKLADAQERLGSTLLLAVVISFLLMAALFEDFLAPLIILVSVPFAAAGGILALRLVDRFLGSQPLDMMASLGFIILLGVVVNNAILIVDGALARLRDGEPLLQATTASVRGRVRPILMSTLTSLAGLLPLVLFPGSGSELYRGVGAIVLGGMALSTLLTLFVVPALFSLLWRFRRGVRL